MVSSASGQPRNAPTSAIILTSPIPSPWRRRSFSYAKPTASSSPPPMAAPSTDPTQGRAAGAALPNREAAATETVSM